MQITNKPEPWFIAVTVIAIFLWWFLSWEVGTTVLLVAGIFQLGNFLEDHRVKINELNERIEKLEKVDS